MKKIIIDTDCGSDDAMAIAAALNDPGYEILCFTCVAGNVTVEQAARNTLFTIETVGKSTPPVYLGCGHPVKAELVGAYETHGNDGMGDLGYAPERLKISDGDAVDRMLEIIGESEDREITLITLGPLTNVAAALDRKPDIMRKLDRVVVMGTAGLGPGNVTEVAEFNIWQDPEAARTVFESGLDIMAVGWDACTGESMLEQSDIDEISSSGKLGSIMVSANRVLMALNRERFGRNCLDMADPAAVAAALYPECIRTAEKYRVKIICEKGPDYGNAELAEKTENGNCTVCSALWPDLYRNYLKERLGNRNP